MENMENFDFSVEAEKKGSYGYPAVSCIHCDMPRFSINKIAYELMGKPKHVKILFDVCRRVVAFKSCDGNMPKAFAITLHKSGVAIVSAHTFIRRSKISSFYGAQLKQWEKDHSVFYVELQEVGA